MRATASALAYGVGFAAALAAAMAAAANGHGPGTTPLPVVGRIMTVECIGLAGAQSVYYELNVPTATRDSFDEQFRLQMNEDSVPTSSQRVRDNFEAVLRDLAIPGRVELLVLQEESGGSEWVHDVCEEQRAGKGALADAATSMAVQNLRG